MKKLFYSLLIPLFLSGCTQPRESMKLNLVATMLESGESTQLKVTGATTGRNLKVNWNCSNPEIAKVGQDGYVLAISPGDAIITATLKKNGETASCRVTVDRHPQNPILPFSWERYIADPEPKNFDGKIYVYGSMDVDNGILPDGINWCSDRYHVIWSDDLLHWNDAGVSFNMDQVPDKYMTPETQRLWAPDLLKHPKNGKYYLFACFNSNKFGNIMVATSEKPEGPFLNPAPLQIDGKEPINKIDPAVLVDDDGKVYATWPFSIGQLDPNDYTRVLGNTIVDVSKNMPDNNDPFEGPSLRKRDGIYYYIYIQNEGPKVLPDGTNHHLPVRMAYMTSKNPLGPYEYQGLIITTLGYPGVVNVHGSLVEFDGEWYVFYHLPVPDKNLTRVTCIDRIEFRPDGTIIPVLPTSSGVRGPFRSGDRIQAGSAVIYPGGSMNPEYISREGNFPVLAFSNPGSHAGIRYIDLKGQNTGTLELNLKTTSGGGKFELRLDEINGPLLANVEIPDTNGKWQEISSKFQLGDTGKHNLFVILTKKSVNGTVELDWLRFAD